MPPPYSTKCFAPAAKSPTELSSPGPLCQAQRQAAATVAEGARAAGRDSPRTIAIADLITTVWSPPTAPPTLSGIRKATGFYAGFFPRYNRALAQNGFPDEAAAIRKAYLVGKRGPDLESLVPDSMLRSLAIIGAPDECRERIQAYRDAGVTLPIIAPRTSGPNAAERAKEIILRPRPLTLPSLPVIPRPREGSRT